MKKKSFKWWSDHLSYGLVLGLMIQKIGKKNPYYYQQLMSVVIGARERNFRK